MKTLFPLLLLLFVLLACQPNEHRIRSANSEPKITLSFEEDPIFIDVEITPPDSLALAIVHRQMLSRYDSLLADLNKRRLELAGKFKSNSNESDKNKIVEQAQKLLHKRLTQDLFPCWYGTPWDFNGISNRPGEGLIACGYFVSTTLKHVGFRLNRYKVAQQAASEIVNLTCSDKKTFNDFGKMMKYLENYPNNLFVVGLDNHVGFIETHKGDVFFTHSSYGGPMEVLREPAKDSNIIPFSEIYVLGEISSTEIIKRWLGIGN